MNKLAVVAASVVSGCGITLATGRLPVGFFGMYGGSDMVLVPTGTVVAVAEEPFWMLTVDPVLDMGTLISLVVVPLGEETPAALWVRILAGVALRGTGLLPAAVAMGFRVTFTCCPNCPDGMTVMRDWLMPMRTG